MDKDGNTLSDIYGTMLAPITEAKFSPKSLDDKSPLELEDGGPSEKGGYKKIRSEKEKTKAKGKKKAPLPEEDEETKNSTKSLNKFMSKSLFDKLYSKVLKENFGQDDFDDESALGLDDATPDSEFDDFEDEGEGEGDQVTLTIDRATAQTLIDLLQTAIGGEDEGEDEGLEDEGEGDEFGGEDELDFEEDEEVGTKVAPDKKKVLQSKSNKVSGKLSKATKRKVSPSVTDETDPLATFNTKYDDGKSNQVKGSNLKKGGEFIK